VDLTLIPWVVILNVWIYRRSMSVVATMIQASAMNKKTLLRSLGLAISAIEKGVLTERFTDQDLRRNAGSDIDLDQATKLLAHSS
jgi:hypothetical protein